MAESWKLFRVLPSIEVPITFESLSNQIAVVPYSDARASAIRARSEGANKLWSGFRDIYGNQLEPSGLDSAGLGRPCESSEQHSGESSVVRRMVPISR